MLKSNINLKNKMKKALFKKVPNDIKYKSDNVTVIIDVEDYIDVTQSTTLNTEKTTISIKVTNNIERNDEKQSMIERLMRTTTKNPTKPNSGDQGAEYSEYYNDINDEVEEEIEKNPRARSIRQSFTPNNNNPIYFQPEQLLSSKRMFPKIRPNRNLNDDFYSSDENIPQYQTEKDPKLNDFHFDANSLLLQSSGDQYNLPLDTSDKNVYNNYGLNLGQEENDLNNYGSLLQKDTDKYLYPLIDNNQEYLMNNQFQLHSDEISTPEINNNNNNNNNEEENMYEVKNPINIYSEPYEKSFVLPSEQQQLHYVPVHKNNKYLENRLYLENPYKKQHFNNTDTLMDINDNLYHPLHKIVDTSSSKKHVRPVEQFLNPVYLNSEEKWNKQDESNDVRTLNQQMNRRGLQKRVNNVMDRTHIYDQSPAVRENQFLELRNGIRNRNSVEEDVANMRHVNIAATVNETKEVADQILNRIVDELEEIKMGNTKDQSHNEGLPCKLTGSWVTNKAGVRLDMKVFNQSIIVTLANLIPQPIHVGLLNTTWNVTGYAPFRLGGPFSLLAYDNHTKTLAIFVGSCKVCQGIDTIQGVWSVSHEPRDCRNFQMAIGIFNDIFRRTKLLTAIQEKKKAILQSLIRNNTNTTLDNVTPKIESEKNNT
ncbi:PREDICTED: MATH and LRR domain-containing protein PFE0570w [Polistes dominula]|uniref:MATH and LRR domain-containing protein PFE0570w n=1 Tax=Polistes dominula TaxID=743375 RepID=A0ABM1IJA0_POLDO|nr:PREDICTED: MATH and LRR domain-containing protein PFE0570w [Polistes dominula]